jgi:tetratricopeptide (TPR) repeat protein
VAKWDWRAGLLWLAFFLLSVYQAAAIPFFAVVACPIIAWNVEQGLTRLTMKAKASGQGGWMLGALGRPLVVVACLALVIVAWPGWLLSGRGEPRRWIVEPEPSLQKAAEQVAQWRKEGKLAEGDRGLNLSPEVAQVFAWFCPAEKSYFASPERLDPHAQSDLRQVREILQRGPGIYPLQSGRLNEVREILRRWQINHVVLFNLGQGFMNPALQQFFLDPKEWPCIFLDGRTLIFGWRDPGRAGSAPDPFAALEVNLEDRAWHPRPEDHAPAASAEGDPGSQPWWQSFLSGRPFWNPDRAEAALYMMHFQALAAPYRMKQLRNAQLAYSAQYAQTIALPSFTLAMPSFSGCVNACAAVPSEWCLRSLPLPFLITEWDDGPPASLVLAIRAARRALRVDPNNAQAYVVLGDAYTLLLQNTRERSWATVLPTLQLMRRAQAAAAFQQALRLQPDLVEAHRKLAVLFEQAGINDLSLKHGKEFLKYLRAAGPLFGQTQEEFAADLEKKEGVATAQEKAVEKSLEQFDIGSLNMRVSDRANLALRLGLGGKALETLLESDLAAFGEHGLRSELSLLLLTGDPKAVRDWMDESHRDALGYPTYYRLRAEQAAALGNYEQADEDMAAMLPKAYRVPTPRPFLPINLEPVSAVTVGALIVGKALLDAVPPGPKLKFYSMGDIQPLFETLQVEAITWLKRGMLALEAGQTDQAVSHFRQALRLAGDDPPPPFEGPRAPRIVRAIARHWLAQLGTGRPRVGKEQPAPTTSRGP